MNKHLILLFGALVSVLAASGCAGGGDDVPETQAGLAVPVRIQPVGSIERRATLSASGTVESPHVVNVGFEVAGRVTRVIPEEGDRVERGSLLAELDSTNYSLARDAAQADLLRARDQYERTRELAERKSAAPADMVKAEGAFQAAKAQSGLAARKVADSRLYAPVSGVIGRRTIEPGAQVSPGAPAFTIVDLDPIRVDVGVPGSAIGRIREGEAASVTLNCLPGQSFQGVVKVVGVIADPATRTYRVRIQVPNPEYVLRPGMIAEALILEPDTLKVLTVPGQAIVSDTEGKTMVYVYFPDKKRVYAARVKVGSVYDREVEIASGLRGDELIVAEGAQQVREGSLVLAITEQSGSVQQ